MAWSVQGTISTAGGVAVLCAGLLSAAAVKAHERERLLRLAGAPPTKRRQGRSGKPGGIISARARRMGWDRSPAVYLALLGVAAVGGGAWGLRLLGPVGLLLGVIGGPLLAERWISHAVRRRSERLEAQVREAVVALAAAVRAGRSIRGALEEAAREVGPPLGVHLEEALRRLRVGGPLDATLRSLGDGIGSADANLLVTVLDIHRRTGGDLPTMLDELAGIVAQRADARRTVRALTAQGRASGAVLAVLPIAFVTLLSWTGGDGLGAFYRTPLGSGLLLAGLACDAGGFLWIRRIIRPRAAG
jgi:tight adherence protein B